MKRDNPDGDELVSGSRSPTCVGLISSCFCSPTTATSITHSSSSGDAFIESEFDKLSATEQERIFRDLYGLDVSAGQMEEDDPAMVVKRLEEMNFEIDAIKSRNEYDEAELRCPQYLEKTKLMFLRAELFNARKAARRYVKHWTAKVEIFGLDRAMNGSICQSDLDEADMESISCGGLQILSEKDRGGRTIFWARRELFQFKARANLVRALWYTVMAHLESDEESQKNGWVALVYNVGPYPLHYFDRELYAKLLKIAKVLPLRIVGYHSCFNDLKLRTVTPFTLLFMGKETRARYRSHIGGHAECLFELLTYGIPLHAMPVTMDGQFDFSSHFNWMERMRDFESKSIGE